ncbi:hypothetical protein [Poseidonocella sp. HB161398]|uniref:hypothetical protein n=1 Tax=Poseidonocella sp. HB161398 TaxID=2320855 RepID=UPI001108B477|nr:hypothetical protein [Poseidonocella sp. HB161398]
MIRAPSGWMSWNAPECVAHHLPVRRDELFGCDHPGRFERHLAERLAEDPEERLVALPVEELAIREPGESVAGDVGDDGGVDHLHVGDIRRMRAGKKAGDGRLVRFDDSCSHVGSPLVMIG